MGLIYVLVQRFNPLGAVKAQLIELQSLMCYTWPKNYHRGSLRKSHQNGDYIKQSMQKSCLPTGFELTTFGLPVH